MNECSECPNGHIWRHLPKDKKDRSGVEEFYCQYCLQLTSLSQQKMMEDVLLQINKETEERMKNIMKKK